MTVQEACEQLRALAAALKAEAMTLEEWADQVAATVEQLDPHASDPQRALLDAYLRRDLASRRSIVGGSPPPAAYLRLEPRPVPADVPA